MSKRYRMNSKTLLLAIFSNWAESPFRFAGAAFFYAFVSVSTTFFNKAVLSIYAFKYTNFLLASQHIFTITILEVLKAMKLISYPKPEVSKCKSLLPVSLLYSLNVGVALMALTSLNIPMYGVLKRMTILVVLIGESIFMKKKSSWEVKQSVILIVLGTIIAGMGDLTFDLVSYLLAFLSCFAQAAYLIFVAKSGAESGINNFGLLFYNSLLAIPFVLFFVILFGEIDEVLNYPHLFEWDFIICFTLNMILGSLLNYSMFLCTTINSALTTTIMGQVKNVASVVLGLFLLETVETNLVNVIGLTLNCLGGIYYAVIKYNEGKMKQSLPITHSQSNGKPTSA